MDEYVNEFDPELFKGINFAERFAEISKRHPIEPEYDLLERLDFDLTKEILESFGYKIRYFRGENFFRATEKREGYEFRFNIILKWGGTELIWSVFHQKQLIREASDTWLTAYESLTGCKWEDVPNYPYYHDYDEMEEVLKECFELWEDFKREFLARYKDK